MAVPGAHDGPVGPDSDRSASLVPTLVAAVSAVVVLACAVTLGVRLSDLSGSVGDRVSGLYGADPEQEAAREAARTRDLVMSQASQFIIRVNTYGPADLDTDSKTLPGYVEKVKEVITPRFAVDFEDNVSLAERGVSELKVERSAEVYATGAETLDDDTATVLVTGAITQSYVDPRQPRNRIEVEPERFRVQVRLVETGGSWLVDNFGPLGADTAGDPAAPTDPADPASPPTGAAPSPEVQRYAEVIANRRVPIDDAVAVLDSCGFPAAARGAACARGPRALTDAARVLVASLRAAANPQSPKFVAEPPAEIADLVTATQAAGVNLLNAAAALPDSCVSATSAVCARQRRTFAGTQTTLLQALSTWDSL